MIDFAVLDAVQLLVVGEGKDGPRRGAEQGTIEIIEHGGLVATDGRIVEVGPSDALRKKHDLSRAKVLDASNRVVMPGLVDPHTHPVFAGLRYEEYALLLGGASKEDVVKKGGGIWKSVLDTREASRETLREALDVYLSRILRSGSTTIEAKSGYGLTTETELMHLELLRDVRTPLRIVPTFLGAHVVPRGMDSDAYTLQIIDEMLPKVAAQGIARYQDVSCSPTTFTKEQCTRMIEAGKKLGLPARVHTDGAVSSGGWEFACSLGAITADHLTSTPEEEIKRVGATTTIASIIPPSELVYRTARRANVRAFIEAGAPVAIATDFCSSIHWPSQYANLSFTAAWFRMTPEEVITSATVNAAYAVGMGKDVGTLTPGKYADVLVVDIPDYRMLAFELGRDAVETVVIGGRVV